jgi:hypothetical protein
MNTPRFLLAIERFLAVRPRPTAFFADNKSNFKGGDSLQRDAPDKKDQIDLQKAEGKFNIAFQFAPPRAPHFQGLIKRFIASAKSAIHLAIHSATDEELRRVFS